MGARVFEQLKLATDACGSGTERQDEEADRQGSTKLFGLRLPEGDALQNSSMASVLKVQTANAAKASAKSKGKRKAEDVETDDVMDVDGPAAPKRKKNKQRVLLLSSRGITHRMRHLMNDLEALLPHVKKGRHAVPAASHS